MKPSLTIEQFEAHARGTLKKQEDLIQSIQTATLALESNLLKFASSPTTEGLAQALQNEIELAGRKALAERITRNYRADSEYQALLNTQAGADVLKRFLDEKRNVVSELKANIKPIRQEALTAEEKGDSELAYTKGEEAAEIVDLVKSYEGHLSTAEQALRRSDATTRYIEIRDGLHLIYA